MQPINALILALVSHVTKQNFSQCCSFTTNNRQDILDHKRVFSFKGAICLGPDKLFNYRYNAKGDLAYVQKLKDYSGRQKLLCTRAIFSFSFKSRLPWQEESKIFPGWDYLSSYMWSIWSNRPEIYVPLWEIKPWSWMWETSYALGHELHWRNMYNTLVFHIKLVQIPHPGKEFYC